MIVAEEFQKLLSFTVGLFESFGIGRNQGETGSHVTWPVQNGIGIADNKWSKYNKGRSSDDFSDCPFIKMSVSVEFSRVFFSRKSGLSIQLFSFNDQRIRIIRGFGFRLWAHEPSKCLKKTWVSYALGGIFRNLVEDIFWNWSKVLENMWANYI